MDWIKKIDKRWTLFLDRDGVLNEERANDYVKTVEELVLYNNIPNTIAQLNVIFGKICIVTNQRGVGRGIMTTQDLEHIHQALLQQLANEKASIDAIYFAPQIENDHPYRKPQIGMAIAAKKDFPEIDFEKSIMVGNSPSDIVFGKNAGMKTVFVCTTKTADSASGADIVCANLQELLNLIVP